MLIALSYAVVAMTTPQWYQTPNVVTAAIKLKGIPQTRLVTSLHDLGSSTVLCTWEVSHLVNVRIHARDTAVVNVLSYCMMQIKLVSMG